VAAEGSVHDRQGASPVHLLICQAIASRQLLMFGYGDLVRVVEPHLFGLNTAGHDALSAWLRAGYSRSDPEGGWRMFLASELREPQMLDEPFAGPRPGYNPDDPHIVRPYCRLEGNADTTPDMAPDAEP
jgi:hypothetical protein